MSCLRVVSGVCGNEHKFKIVATTKTRKRVEIIALAAIGKVGIIYR